MRWIFSFFVIVTYTFAIDSEIGVENTNIASKSETQKGDDYNRLRVNSKFSDPKYDNFLAEFIVDNYNNYIGEQKDNTNKTKLYRGYLNYSDAKQIIVIGKQRIPFGVGRVWNPIDIYNPINSTAIETDERKGTDAIRYEYYLNDLSDVDAIVSKHKEAFRIKGTVKDTDLGLLFLKDKQKDQNILGYIAEGELLDTGIELRSEGGYFFNKESENYKEMIFGAEYSFANSLTVLGEYKYNSLNNIDHMALKLSYTISTLWECSYLGIQNLDDKSNVNLARFDYSLSDDSELDFGVYTYSGNDESEYGLLKNSAFIRYYIHF